MTKWNYNGDINLEYGGFFWREDGAKDYVLAVRVTPCSDAGGPDNLFHVETGSLYMPQDATKANAALSCCGYSLRTDGAVADGSGFWRTGRAARALLVDAWMAYHGMDLGREYVIRIGRADPDATGWCANETPDHVLRGGSSLRNFVKRELLSA